MSWALAIGCHYFSPVNIQDLSHLTEFMNSSELGWVSGLIRQCLWTAVSWDKCLDWSNSVYEQQWVGTSVWIDPTEFMNSSESGQVSGLIRQCLWTAVSRDECLDWSNRVYESQGVGTSVWIDLTEFIDRKELEWVTKLTHPEHVCVPNCPAVSSRHCAKADFGNFFYRNSQTIPERLVY